MRLRVDETLPESEFGRCVLQSEDARMLGQIINERLDTIIGRRQQSERERATLPSSFLPPLH